MKNKIKIVADKDIPFLKGVLEPFADIKYYSGENITNEKILEADALIIRTRTKCTSNLLENTKVKLITTATIGFDHIDTEYCKKNGIAWANAPGCNSTSVMQYISSALLTLLDKNKESINNKTIGIIGVGNVGKKVEKFARAIGMKVMLNDPPREKVEGNNKFSTLETIQNECEVITFHVPLNKIGRDQTYHLADKDFFSNLKKKPIIINSSRGEVVETSALKYAIKNQLISHSVIDVWENEPDIDKELLSLVDLGTPHIAGYSVEGKANGTAVCVNKVNEIFQLGLEIAWYPHELPIPEHNSNIKVNCAGNSLQNIVSHIINYSYPILKDDFSFRLSPQNFEKLRNYYPVRREFSFYNVESKNCDQVDLKTIEKLGFLTKI